MNSVSENLKKIRKEKSLTQQQMADILFVTQQTVSNWEKGKNMPTVDMLGDIADKLGVEVYDLLYTCNDITARQEKKAKNLRIIVVVMLPVFFAVDKIGMEIKAKTYMMDVYIVERVLILPFILFSFAYIAVLIYRIKDRGKKNTNLLLRYIAQIMVAVYILLTIGVYIGYTTVETMPMPDILRHILVKIWNIRVLYPWVYTVLGAVYGMAEVWDNRVQGAGSREQGVGNRE